jgi:O-methyltransferase
LRRRIRPTDAQLLFDRFGQYTMLNQRHLAANVALVTAHAPAEGCVVECGVWRGGAIAAIASTLGPQRTYVLFDSFEGLPPAAPIDGRGAAQWQADKDSPEYYDNCAAEERWAREAMSKAGATDVTLVKGWFDATVPHWTAPNAIAVLRLDGDWYASTKVCLDALVPQLADDAIVIIDDYYAWDGCARAVHEWLEASPRPLRLRQHPTGIAYVLNRASDPR